MMKFGRSFIMDQDEEYLLMMASREAEQETQNIDRQAELAEAEALYAVEAT